MFAHPPIGLSILFRRKVFRSLETFFPKRFQVGVGNAHDLIFPYCTLYLLIFLVEVFSKGSERKSTLRICL